MTMSKILNALFLLAASMGGAQTQDGNQLANSHVFPYEQMPVKTGKNGAESRGVVHGSLATGEAVAIHESLQPAGMEPNPAHKIQHSELIVVQQGTLDFQHDGKVEQVGPGGVIYVALGTMHTIKNVGPDAAKYVVIQIGGDTK